MYFSKKDREYIGQYEENLHTAYYADWSRNIPQSKLEKLLEIYKKIAPDYRMCMHCSSSVLRFLKELAGKYYADINEIKNKKNSRKCRKN